MKQKKDNNLIAVIYEDGEKRYYTSYTRAGRSCGIAQCSVDWAVRHENVLTDMNDRKFQFKIVDGSDIPYKLINNL